MLIAHPYPLIQIGETDVEKLVAYLDINKMRENPMVRDQQSTYMQFPCQRMLEWWLLGEDMLVIR